MKRMRGGRSWKLFAVIGAVVTTVTVGLVATTASAKSDQDVTLTVSLFGDFGYHDLYKKYEKAHPGVTIKESIQDFGTHHTQLAQRIAVGAGAADIEAIEVGYIPQFTPQPQKFVNLLDHGASALKKHCLPWKWEQAVGKGGAMSVSAPTSAAWPCATARTCSRRPACPPTATRCPQALADVAGVHRHRQAVPGQGPEAARGSSTRRPNIYNAILGQSARRLLRRRGDKIVANEPGREGRLGHRRSSGDRRRAVGAGSPRSRPTGTPASRRATSPPSPARRG